MNSAIQVFSNQEFSVRTTRDADGTVWFVAKDVAQCLEYSEATITSNISNLFKAIPEVWKGNKRIITPGGEQEMLCLTEQGVYFFLGRSDKPKALPYQMWIAGDVVPTLRETGSYSTQTPNLDKLFSLQGAKFIYETHGLEGNQLVLALDKIYKRQTGFSALEAANVQLEAPDSQQLLTPTEIGRQFEVSARTVNDILAGAGYQYKVADKWEPLELGKPYAVMLDVGKKRSDGVPVRQLKWTSGIIPVFQQLLEATA